MKNVRQYGDKPIKAQEESKRITLKRLLVILTIFYFAWIIFSGDIGHGFMIWNVFLAWVPFGIVSLIGYVNSKFAGKDWVKMATIFLGILWLLFYPNSTYLFTDFIHLGSNEYYFLNPNYSPYSNEARVLLNSDIRIWLDLATIAVGVSIGYVFGFLSLYINQRSLIKKYNKKISWIVVSIVHLLTGFAIYIGRFNRWNSWDIILHPKNIFTIIQSSMNLKAFQFTLLFGFFSFVVYFINYLLVEIGKFDEI